MGTRADFYVGRGENAEWLGSIAWDGYPDGIDKNILHCTQEDVYRDFVKLFVSSEDSGTLPEQGWPWPWKDSQTTDYAYAFDDGKVYACPFGFFWYCPATESEPNEEENPEMFSGKTVEFPDMSDMMNVARDNRSGLLIIRAR